MNTSDFLAIIQKSGEYTRSNRFELEITPPSKINVQQDVLRRICANCKRAPIPGRSLAFYEYNQGGYTPRKMAHTQIYTEANLVFNLSQDKAEKELFDAWQDIVSGFNGNLEYYREYIGTFSVKSRSIRQGTENNGQSKKKEPKYVYLEAWPVSVQEVDLDMGSNDTIAELSVQMAYHSWITE